MYIKNINNFSLIIFVFIVRAVCVACGENAAQSENQLDSILRQIEKQSQTIVSLLSDIDYLVIQDPDLTQTTIKRTGKLYYLKTEKQSFAKIVFETVQEDDFDVQERKEVFLFDGVWLVKIDYTLRQAEQIQQAEPDNPLDAFAYLSRYFPLIGLPGCPDVRQDFNVEMIGIAENANYWQLQLTAKPESRWAKDYKSAQFWLDRKTYLPQRVQSISAQGDIYDIRFDQMTVNSKIDPKIFALDIPKGFQVNTQPLPKKSEKSDTKG